MINTSLEVGAEKSRHSCLQHSLRHCPFLALLYLVLISSGLDLLYVSPTYAAGSDEADSVARPEFISCNGFEEFSGCVCDQNTDSDMWILENADQSAIFGATNACGEVVYLGNRNADGTASSLNSVSVLDYSGARIDATLDSEGRPTFIANPEQGETYEIEWLSSSELRVTATAQTEEGFLQETVEVNLQDAAFNAITKTGKSEAEQHDTTLSSYSMVVSAQREIYDVKHGSIGQYTAQAGPASTPIRATAGTADVFATQCGAPTTVARVGMSADSGIPLLGGPIPLLPIYEIDRVSFGVPRFDASQKVDNVFDVCESGARLASQACAATGSGTAIIEVGNRVCPRLILNPYAFVGCFAAFRATGVYCVTLGSNVAPGAPSPGEAVCDGLQFITVEALTSDEIELHAEIQDRRIGFPDFTEEQTTTAPASGPFPDFTFTLPEQFGIESASVLEEGTFDYDYRIAIETACASVGTELLVNVESTAGWSSSGNCFPANDNNSCLLDVRNGRLDEDGQTHTIILSEAGGSMLTTLRVTW